MIVGSQEPTATFHSSNDPSTNYVSMELGQGAEAPEVFKDEGDDDDDDEDDNDSVRHTIVSSVVSADGIHDVTGFNVVCLVILIGDMSRGVFFPTLWPLVDSLGGSTVSLGYAVAAFSGGRIVTSPFFGYLSVTLGYTWTLVISVLCLLLGTLAYAQIQNVGTPHFLIVAQIILGMGSGTLGVTRAFVADVTAKRNRTTYMALITAVQYAGFTVTPFIGALLIQVFGDREFRWGLFRLNKFTSPAYFMGLVCLGTLLCLLVFFNDRHTFHKERSAKVSSRKIAVAEVADSRVLFGFLSVYDACILGCMLLNIATKGSIACFETLGIEYAVTHFNMPYQQAGMLVATCGTFGVVALLSMGALEAMLSDVQLICGGMVVMSAGIISLLGLEADVDNPHWRYFFAMFLIYAVGYPVGHTAVIGLFSKIVGRRPQGLLLGWFAAAGSLARMMFPIMAGYIAHLTDVVVLFLILTTVLAVSTAFVLLSRKTLNLLSS